MLTYWCQTWSANLEASFENIRDSKNGFNEMAIKYYSERIKKTMDKVADKIDSAEKARIHQCAAFVVLNIKITFLEPQWEISGLFYKGNSKIDNNELIYMCVCPPVSKAFIKYLTGKYEPTIDALVSISSCFLSFNI